MSSCSRYSETDRRRRAGARHVMSEVVKQIFSGTIEAMRTPTKFVSPLTNEERQQLKEIHRADANWRTRMRAHAILLSRKDFPSISWQPSLTSTETPSVNGWIGGPSTGSRDLPTIPGAAVDRFWTARRKKRSIEIDARESAFFESRRLANRRKNGRSNFPLHAQTAAKKPRLRLETDASLLS